EAHLQFADAAHHALAILRALHPWFETARMHRALPARIAILLRGDGAFQEVEVCCVVRAENLSAAVDLQPQRQDEIAIVRTAGDRTARCAFRVARLRAAHPAVRTGKLR